MKLPRYQLKTGDKLTSFEFISEGPAGRIHKLVQFSPTNVYEVYNLAFGDKHPATGEIDDTVISNNGDSEKVLATVIASVYAFTDKYPRRSVYAAGSTKSRTRLYRMGITKHLSDVRKDFQLYGVINNETKVFRRNINYDAFLVVRKKP